MYNKHFVINYSGKGKPAENIPQMIQNCHAMDLQNVLRLDATGGTFCYFLALHFVEMPANTCMNSSTQGDTLHCNTSQ